MGWLRSSHCSLRKILVTQQGAPLQGVPIRLALGPKDLQKQTVELARRDTGAKEFVPWAQALQRIQQLLEEIQVTL